MELTRFIEELENQLGMTAEKDYRELQPGDVPATYADIDDLYEAVGFKPVTGIEEGIRRFVEWYKGYYSIS